ncbi:DUF4190 domain-containing protein [Treponema sp. R6D11]
MKMIVKIVGLVLCVLFFTLPVVQCSQDSNLNATSWQIATKTGRLMENADNGFPVVFILLLIPIVLLVIAFINKSFSVLRNISIAGLIAKCAFIVIANILLKSDDFEGAFILTPYVWLIIVIYAGLICFTQYCISKKIDLPEFNNNKQTIVYTDDPKKDVFATISLILGILGFLLFLPAIPGVILGVIGLKSMKRKMATAGIITSIVGALFSMLVILIAIKR